MVLSLVTLKYTLNHPVMYVLQSRFLALDSRNHLARVATCAELQVPDPLPGPGCQTAVGDGDIHGGANESRFDMSLKRIKGMSISVIP